MFQLPSRRYTGSKTRLLPQIEYSLFSHLKTFENLIFFDVFAGTGVVSWHFMKNFTKNAKKNSIFLNDKKPLFSKFLINDFLYSNYAIYQGFFAQETFEIKKLEELKQTYNKLNPENLKQNYYKKSFGGLFFSQNDAAKIGFIRDDLDSLLKNKKITNKEFYILLASLIYSADRIANTVGHYDAYRKNITLRDKLKFNLIEPLKCACEVEFFKEDANILSKTLLLKNEKIDVAFLDPPYNSRQYSRAYHFLETLARNNKPALFGVARKPKTQLLSDYCTNNAIMAFGELVANLAKFAKILLITYNNTVSANPRSNTRMNATQIIEMLNSVGKTQQYSFDFQAFSTGKTNFNNHKEMIFVCEIE